MESSWLRSLFTVAVNFEPLALVDIELMDVVETLLIRINSSKNVNITSA